MKAHEEAFSFIRKEYFYDVPFFQRNYVWTYENWEELLDSLTDSAKCSFLGSIILKQESTPSGSVGRFSIIDGQQRLTTLSILMRACYDTLMKNKSLYPEKAINGFDASLDAQLFVTIDTFTGEKEVKIRHSHIDRPYFESVINGDYSSDEKLAAITLREEAEADPKNRIETKNRILLCYKYYRVRLANLATGTIQMLWNTLIKDDVKFLVNIDLYENENEQAIFDAVNSSGVRLTSSDTIKNALFQHYIDVCRSEMPLEKAEATAVRLYERTWTEAFMKSDEDAEYWASSHQSGRLMRDNIEILLHCVAVIEGFFEPQEMKMSELAQCYKEHISPMSRAELEDFICKIKNYADLYREKIVTNESCVLYSYRDYFTRLIHILDTLEISTFHPYLLFILYKNKLTPDEESFKKSCEKLERYVLLHAICRATTKNYNKECIQLINGETVDTLLESCDDINDARFVSGLRELDSSRTATLILFWVELYMRFVEKTDLQELKYTYTLEHIMPQKWQEYWGVDVLPVISPDGSEISDSDDAERIRAHAVYEIGNMTLLNSKLNTSLRNYTFGRKVQGEGRKKGMRDLADCMLTREIIIEPFWNEAIIRERTEKLTSLIRKVWGISF